MLRFLEDADLVEQERDDIKRILFDEKQSTCQFPFNVDTNIGRTEDETTSCSYGHRSSSESLRAEAEACSSTDTRQSPVISSAPSTSSSSNIRRQFSTSGSNAGRSEQLHRTLAPSYFDLGSPKRNDSQMNGNLPQFMSTYPNVGMVSPTATTCFSPPYMPAAACHYYPQTFQWQLPVYFPNGHFFVPQVLPRSATQLPVHGGTNQQPFLRMTPAAPTAAQHLYYSRMFTPNIDHQNIHYAVDNSIGAAASFTGSAIIQDDPSSSSSSSLRTFAHVRTNSNDEYQQQPTSCSPANPEGTVSTSCRDLTASPTTANEDDEEEDRTSCDSPTIVIEADQNAAAIASRQRASALMNANSSHPTVTAAISIAKSSDTPSIAEQSPAEETTSVSPPPGATPIIENNMEYSTARSPRLLETDIDITGLDGGAPVSPVAADVYYDAEDKPLQRNSQTLDVEAKDNSHDSVFIDTPPVDISAANGEASKITLDPITTPSPANENDDSMSTSSIPAAQQKSWASLFKGTPTANSAIVVTNTHSEKRSTGKTAVDQYVSDHLEKTINVVPVEDDPGSLALADALRKSEIMDRGPTFHLRGIMNRGNWCYVNASLQALMACPPFFHFLRNLSHVKERTPTSTPLLDAFIKFANEFPLVKSRSNPRLHEAVDPSYLHSVITRFKADATFKGRQEDAEEFLLQVFNVLHDEMVSCLSVLEKDRSGTCSRERSVNGETVDEADNSEWHQVGPGRKAAVTRQTKYSQSPLSQIFLGQLRYGLSQPGAKESANLEPFYTLPLDVQITGVKDLASALQAFTSKEKLKSFSGKNKAEVDATRHVTFHELPRVLIFQLKYFVYAEDGLKKIMKHIDYPMDLMIDPHLLFNRGKTGSQSTRQYKLFAVLFHHGEKAEGGHYTVDIFHGGQWMHVDDTRITQVGNEHVLKFEPPRVPYLLFYRRWDTNGSSSSTSSPESQQQLQQTR